mmetsp:Transcript_113297/g.360136  ORF Transcript_113297/g.360136 Transcript_113297/m.360136 type:complete len:203 (-) Transcript_113297:2071-2679(-)
MAVPDRPSHRRRSLRPRLLPRLRRMRSRWPTTSAGTAVTATPPLVPSTERRAPIGDPTLTATSRAVATASTGTAQEVRGGTTLGEPSTNTQERTKIAAGGAAPSPSPGAVPGARRASGSSRAAWRPTGGPACPWRRCLSWRRARRHFCTRSSASGELQTVLKLAVSGPSRTAVAHASTVSALVQSTTSKRAPSAPPWGRPWY